MQAKALMMYEKNIENFKVITCVSRLFHENSYILQDCITSKAHIIDPGDCLDELVSEISRIKAQPEAILLTHGHFDHVYSALHLSEHFKIPVYLSNKDYKLMRRASIYGFRFARKKIPVPEVKFYQDSPPLALAHQTIDIIPTPGHTQGSVCLNYSNVMFSGDTLFYQHIGPTNYPESNLDDLFSSVDSMLSRAIPEALIFSGHGRPWVAHEAKEWFEKLDRLHPPQYLISNDPSIQAKGMMK